MPRKAINDKFFFERVKEFNDKGDQGGTHLVQMDRDYAMLIFWGRNGWEYKTYKLEHHTGQQL